MTKHITRSTVAVAASVLLLLVLAGQALGEHGSPRHDLAVGTTADRIHITTHPHATPRIETFTLDFAQGGYAATGWHTHPGQGLVTVTSGEFELQRVTPRGCIETIPYGPGDAFFEDGRAVHQLVLTSPSGQVYGTFVTPQGETTGHGAAAPTGPLCEVQ